MTEPKAYVFNIQPYSLHDGPGIRTIVFLKGCPMACRWCCNPESQQAEPEISYVASECIGKAECGYCQRVCPAQAITFHAGEGGGERAAIDFNACTQCQACAKACPAQAITVKGKAYGVSELLDIVEKEAVFYRHGQGGLTVSGGEPLVHQPFLTALLKGAKERHISTAIETCGNAPYQNLRDAAPYLDTILFDIKSMNSAKHQAYTGFGNEQILENFRRLCAAFPDLPKRVRTPVIPGFNDTPEDIELILDFLRQKPNVTYEALPYHTFGKGKYAALGRTYPMGDVALSQEMKDYITYVNGGSRTGILAGRERKMSILL